MKKKPNNKAEKYMIGAAVALLIIAFIGVVFLVLDSCGILDNINKPGETTVDETTIPKETVIHQDVETETNSDGTPKRVVYYKDNVYDGSIDYVYEGASVYEVYFDANDELVGSIKKTINDVGSIIYESHSEKDKITTEIEYTYYEDLVTVWKKLTTDKSGEKEIATKELFTKEGLRTDKYVYEDSVEMSHIVYTYDENGEILSEEEITK